MKLADGAALGDTLHEYGVNLRYLGQLATLAKEQEQIDVDAKTENKQFVQKMPFFWLELLEVCFYFFLVTVTKRNTIR
jgi:hypothetical protein